MRTRNNTRKRRKVRNRSGKRMKKNSSNPLRRGVRNNKKIREERKRNTPRITPRALQSENKREPDKTVNLWRTDQYNTRQILTENILLSILEQWKILDKYSYRNTTFI